MTSPSYRFRWLDYLRGLAILVIVFVHVRNGLINAGLIVDGPGFVSASRVVTLSVLPLFFFMSGMFVRSSIRRGMGSFVGDKIRTIAYPYFLWSAIYLVANSAMAGSANHELGVADLGTIILQPVVHYWFFYCLFSITMFYGLATRVGLGPKAILALALAVYGLRFLPLAQTQAYAFATLEDVYLPCFALGALVNRGGPVVALSEARLSTLVALAVGGYLASWGIVALGVADRAALALPALLPGALALMSLAILLERLGSLRVLGLLGRSSLAIYVAHVFGVAAMRLLLHGGLGVENLWVHFALGIAAGAALPFVPLKLAELAGFPYLFTLRGLEWRRPQRQPA